MSSSIRAARMRYRSSVSHGLVLQFSCLFCFVFSHVIGPSKGSHWEVAVPLVTVTTTTT